MLADSLTDLDVAAIVRGDHVDPFAILGPHVDPRTHELTIRTFAPDASGVEVLDAASGAVLAGLPRRSPAGFFAGNVPGATPSLAYRLRVTAGERSTVVEDPYRFGTVLGAVDLHLIGEGRHLRLYEKFGAHETTMDGVSGVAFAVWAPNARRVSVVGNFNDWDGRRHPMRLRVGAGIWEIFVPSLALGTVYKYEILAADGRRLPLKADPYGFAAERTPATASIVARAGAEAWDDAAWMARRKLANQRDAPIAIYEVHLGSWKRAEENRYLTYRELADGSRAVRRRPRLHTPRAASDFGIPVRWLVGLSSHRHVRADQPIRDAAGLRVFCRTRARGRARRVVGLGAGSFSDRRPRTWRLRRHASSTSTRIPVKASNRTGTR